MRTPMTTNDRPTLGDLAPVESILEWLDAWRAHDRERRPEEDPVLHTLDEVHRRLAQAVSEAKNPAAEISVEELAEREGVSVAALYKRRQRGKLPQARKRGGRLVVPVSSLDR